MTYFRQNGRDSCGKSKQIETPQRGARGGLMLARGKRAHSAENSLILKLSAMIENYRPNPYRIWSTV
ncbi:hypothetical protein CYL18_05675 [Pradoshia eiseniae]|uniref:Uncharacterized protein n=1 Tax=Pradoshia eiseniae TaxID=2064768 RepID=A0A2S7N276_9BACI|nr:hypothetical protein CYL18_05675 [Pradoshia eiseniae]